MLAKLRNKLRLPWGQRPVSSIAEIPKLLHPAELTKFSWATHIKSYADVPDVYKDFFEPILADGCAFPYTVMTPSYERFIHTTTEKLISDFGHDIYILERKGDSFEIQCYPVDRISYVEIRTALLASSFTICGMTNRGVHTSTTLKFNTVTDHLFTPILKRARPLPVNSKNVTQGTEIEKFNCLAEVNFKFMNFAKRSLLEGEKVIQFILQPEIQEELLTILKKTFYRTISATHMCILTKRELILIREDATQRKDDRYGGFWNYIPLEKITTLSVNQKSNDLLGLTVQLPESTCFELLFQVSAKDEINRLLNQYKELTAQ